MAQALNTALVNHVADAFFDSFNGGTLDLRTGAQPTTADDAATGTLLLSIDLPSPAFAPAVGGIKEKAGTWAGEGEPTAGSGTEAGWCRFTSSDGARVLDGAVTSMGGQGELELDNVNIAAGQNVVINSGAAEQPRE